MKRLHSIVAALPLILAACAHAQPDAAADDSATTADATPQDWRGKVSYGSSGHVELTGDFRTKYANPVEPTDNLFDVGAATGAEPAPQRLAQAEPAAAETPAPIAAPQPAAQTSADAEQWLDRIEAKAKEVRTLEAKLNYITEQALLGDEQRRFGSLVYRAADAEAEEPSKFRVAFDRVVVDEELKKENRAFIFDGRWLGERIEDDEQKVFIRRQLVPDDEKAQDLLDVEGGPFVLPLNLRKDRVLRRFSVEVVPPAEGDPKNTVHLQLTPRPGADVDQQSIDMWFDRETLLPVKVVTIHADESVDTITLRDVKLNPKVDGKAFDTTPPRGREWEIEEKPLESE